MMKAHLIIILTIGCLVNGCSTRTNVVPHVAQYSEVPATPSGTATEAQLKRDREDREFRNAFTSADLVLWTDDYRSFKITKPENALATHETLREVLYDKKIRGRGAAFIVVPFFVSALKAEKPSNFEGSVEKMLKDAGFTDVRFCTPLDLLRVP